MSKDEIELETEKIQAIKSLSKSVQQLTNVIEGLVVELRDSPLSGNINALQERMAELSERLESVPTN